MRTCCEAVASVRQGMNTVLLEKPAAEIVALWFGDPRW